MQVKMVTAASPQFGQAGNAMSGEAFAELLAELVHGMTVPNQSGNLPDWEFAPVGPVRAQLQILNESQELLPVTDTLVEEMEPEEDGQGESSLPEIPGHAVYIIRTQPDKPAPAGETAEIAGESGKEVHSAGIKSDEWTPAVHAPIELGAGKDSNQIGQRWITQEITYYQETKIDLPADDRAEEDTSARREDQNFPPSSRHRQQENASTNLSKPWPRVNESSGMAEQLKGTETWDKSNIAQEQAGSPGDKMPVMAHSDSAPEITLPLANRNEHASIASLHTPGDASGEMGFSGAHMEPTVLPGKAPAGNSNVNPEQNAHEGESEKSWGDLKSRLSTRPSEGLPNYAEPAKVPVELNKAWVSLGPAERGENLSPGKGDNPSPDQRGASQSLDLARAELPTVSFGQDSYQENEETAVVPVQTEALAGGAPKEQVRTIPEMDIPPADEEEGPASVIPAKRESGTIPEVSPQSGYSSGSQHITLTLNELDQIPAYVYRHLESSAGDRQIIFKLDPPELGEVTVMIRESTDAGLEARVLLNRDIPQQQIDALVARFSEMGRPDVRLYIQMAAPVGETGLKQGKDPSAEKRERDRHTGRRSEKAEKTQMALYG